MINNNNMTQRNTLVICQWKASMICIEILCEKKNIPSPNYFAI